RGRVRTSPPSARRSNAGSATLRRSAAESARQERDIVRLGRAVAPAQRAESQLRLPVQLRRLALVTAPLTRPHHCLKLVGCLSFAGCSGSSYSFSSPSLLSCFLSTARMISLTVSNKRPSG